MEVGKTRMKPPAQLKTLQTVVGHGFSSREKSVQSRVHRRFSFSFPSFGPFDPFSRIGIVPKFRPLKVSITE